MVSDDDVAVAAGTPTDQLAAPAVGARVMSTARAVEFQRQGMEMDSLESLEQILKDEKHPLHDICTVAKMARELGEHLRVAVMSDDPNTKNAQINTKLFLGCIKEIREGGHQILAYILPRLGNTRLEVRGNDEAFTINLNGLGGETDGNDDDKL